MPWWLWIVGALVLLVVLLVSARASWRRAVREELIAVLREKHPEITIVAEHASALDLALPGGGQGTLNLENLYAGLAMGETPTAEERHAAIVSFAAGIAGRITEASGPLTLETHGDRLLPRLVAEAMVKEPGTPEPLPHTPSGIPGLVVAYVLDSEMSVMYLTESHRRELGTEVSALHERTLANLRRTFPALVVRQSVEQQKINVLKAGDTFDATRLLLVPEQLQEGEALAAAIPDRETLVLAPVPADGNWDGMAKIARTPASPYELLSRPLKVTRAGFELIQP